MCVLRCLCKCSRLLYVLEQTEHRWIPRASAMADVKPKHKHPPWVVLLSVVLMKALSFRSPTSKCCIWAQNAAARAMQIAGKRAALDEIFASHNRALAQSKLGCSRMGGDFQGRENCGDSLFLFL